jgi:hypothetical protein
MPWLIPVISAGIGLISSLFGKSRQAKEEQARLEQQKKTALEQYRLGRAYSDRQYGIQERQAYSDLALQERRLGQGVTQSLEEINTGLLGQAYGIQNARIQTASSIGASLAAEGMGGTRGNAAGGLMRAYEQTSLERNAALQNRQNDLTINALTAQAGNALEDINRERASWKAGGSRYQQKAAQDEYNLKTAELGQSNFDRAIEQAQPTTLDYFGAGFSGVSAGLQFGSSVDSFFKDWFGDSVGGLLKKGLTKSVQSSYADLWPGANSSSALKDRWW